jgi:hypothetical protein
MKEWSEVKDAPLDTWRMIGDFATYSTTTAATSRTQRIQASISPGLFAATDRFLNRMI